MRTRSVEDAYTNRDAEDTVATRRSNYHCTAVSDADPPTRARDSHAHTVTRGEQAYKRNGPRPSRTRCELDLPSLGGAWARKHYMIHDMPVVHTPSRDSPAAGLRASVWGRQAPLVAWKSPDETYPRAHITSRHTAAAASQASWLTNG